MNVVCIRKIFSALLAAGTLLAGASELCARTFNVFLLTGQSNSLGVHYDGNAQLVIGRRFADAFFAVSNGEFLTGKAQKEKKK